MKNIHSKIIIIIFALTLIAGSRDVGAQAGAVPAPVVPTQNSTFLTPLDGSSPNTFGTDETQPIVDPRDRVGSAPAPAGSPAPAAAGSDRYLIKNPLSKTTTLSQVILNVISIVRILLIMAAVLYLLYAGFMFVTARGEPGKIVKARNALLWGCVGIALILSAQVLITSLQNTVNGILS